MKKTFTALSFGLGLLTVFFLLPNISKASQLIDNQPLEESVNSFTTQSPVNQFSPSVNGSTLSQLIIGQYNDTGNQCNTTNQFIQILDASFTVVATSDIITGAHGVGSSPTFVSYTFSVPFTFGSTGLYSWKLVHNFYGCYFNNQETFKLAGTQYDYGSRYCTSTCGSIVSYYYEAYSEYSVSFLNPSEYSTPTGNVPAGVDFPNWILQVNYLPPTSTPYNVEINYGSNSDTYTLPPYSTATNTSLTLTIPKSQILVGTSSTTPIYYSATAEVFASSTLITSNITYFGIFSSGSSYSFYNYYTPLGYAASSTQPSTVEAQCSNSNVIVYGICKIFVFLLYPPDFITSEYKSIVPVLMEETPFNYVSAAYTILQYVPTDTTTPEVSFSYSFANPPTQALPAVSPGHYELIGTSSENNIGLAPFVSLFRNLILWSFRILVLIFVIRLAASIPNRNLPF